MFSAFPFGSTFPTINVTLDDDESDSPTAPVEPVTGIIASEPDVSNSPNVPSSNDNRDLEQGSNLIETPKDGKEFCKETSLSSESHRQWKRQILSLLKELTSIPCSHLFLHPVRADIAPLYYDVLKHPISLNAIKQKVRDDLILTSEEVYRDLLVLVYNAKVYNGQGSVVFEEAEELLRKIKELFQGILKMPKHEK